MGNPLTQVAIGWKETGQLNGLFTQRKRKSGMGGKRTERETENIPAGYRQDHADPILRSYIIMVPILLHPPRVSKTYT
jgi:hypothetical protein